MTMSDAIGLEIERREEVPERVRRCTTHHHACDCREWAHEQAIIAREQEIEEQARLLGASGSREAELLARVEALTNELTAAGDALLEAEKLEYALQARIEALEAENRELRLELLTALVPDGYEQEGE